MALKFKEVKGRTLEATDGNIGTVKDVLFDDQSWRVRYFVVDTGNWLPGRGVLLSPASFASASQNIKYALAVNLTKQQIKDSLSLESDKPVSRQNANTTMPSLAIDRQKISDGHLRSLDEITGYKVKTNDGYEFGGILDVLIETSDWIIMGLVLTSRKWLPGGKEFVCSPILVNRIDEKSKLLLLAQNKRTLIDGTEFDIGTYEENVSERTDCNRLCSGSVENIKTQTLRRW